MGQNYTGFDAKQAKKIVDDLQNDEQELNGILFNIKEEALKGQTRLFIYNSLKPRTIVGLKQRGFDVERADQMAIQKDSLYYSITWY